MLPYSQCSQLGLAVLPRPPFLVFQSLAHKQDVDDVNSVQVRPNELPALAAAVGNRDKAIQAGMVIEGQRFEVGCSPATDLCTPRFQVARPLTDAQSRLPLSSPPCVLAVSVRCLHGWACCGAEQTSKRSSPAPLRCLTRRWRGWPPLATFSCSAAQPSWAL